MAPRRYTIQILLLGAFSIANLHLVSAQTGVQVNMTYDPPTFFEVCVDPVPSFPPDVPGSLYDMAKINKIACNGLPYDPNSTITGYLLKLGFEQNGGGVPAGDNVVQTIHVSGIAYKTTSASTQCGDVEVPFSDVVVEYFKQPVVDYQSHMQCCEERVALFLSADVAFLGLPTGPGGVDPVDQGENAEFIDGPLGKLIYGKVKNAYTLLWELSYLYDGCQPFTPKTTCGKMHCIKLTHQNRKVDQQGNEGFNQPTTVQWSSIIH